MSGERVAVIAGATNPRCSDNGSVPRPRSRYQHSFAQDLLMGISGILMLLVLSLPSLPAHAEGEETAEAMVATKPSVEDEAHSILAEIDELTSGYRELNVRVGAEKDDEEKAIAELQAHRRLVDWMRAIDRLVANLLEQREQGRDTKELLQKTRKLLWSIERVIPEFMDKLMAKNAELRGALSDATPETLTTAEARLRRTEETLDETVRFYLSLVQYLDRLELGSKRARAGAAEKLVKRAGDLSARLELVGQELEDIKTVAGDLANTDEQVALRDAQEAFDQAAASLWTTCDVMDELELPTAEYRQVLFLATGELTTDILDTEVLSRLVGDGIESTQRWMEHRGPAILGKIAMFVFVLGIFWILAGIIRRVVPHIVASSGEQLSELAGRVIVGITSRLVIAIGVIVALSQVGVNITALLAGVGIVGFIIGFALQETLGNFAAGTMILIYRPFDVGDVIEAGGVLGKVDDMTLVSTRILTFDNQTMIVPNTQIWGNVIRNTTALEKRRVDLSFPLALDADARGAESLFVQMCREHPAVLEEPPPAVKVQKVSGSGLLFVVRPWVRTEDYWETFWELNREAYIRLADAGIRIARPRYEIESQDAGTKSAP
jgi:small conductance mechanosensitive channel